MSFTNITDEELEGKGVTGLPDTPGLSTIEMQQKFDEYSVFLKDKLKTLISELEAEAGALNIGATVPENITADGNIQSILDGLRQYVDDTVVALGTGDMATGIYDPNRDGVIAPAQGGTGQTSMQGARNAMGLGNTLNALPIENGGTGANSAAGARENLGLGNTTGPLPVINGGTGVTSKEALKQFLYGDAYKVPVSGGGTGKTSVTAGSVLVGNGADTMTERTIDSTSGGTQGSDALITSGAVNAKVREMQTTFQDGVDAVYNALVDIGITPTASTPTAIAETIAQVGSGNASAAQILSGKTAFASNALLTGTMANKGAWTGATTGSGNVTIPAGFHNGSGYVSGSGAYNAGRNQGRADKKAVSITIERDDDNRRYEVEYGGTYQTIGYIPYGGNATFYCSYNGGLTSS